MEEKRKTMKEKQEKQEKKRDAEFLVVDLAFTFNHIIYSPSPEAIALEKCHFFVTRLSTARRTVLRLKREDKSRRLKATGNRDKSIFFKLRPMMLTVISGRKLFVD